MTIGHSQGESGGRGGNGNQRETNERRGHHGGVIQGRKRHGHQ